MKTIVIGDIHGCYDEFIELLAKCDINYKRDKLVILGDFIDKGPKSCEVLNELYEIDRIMRNRLIILEGNHEYNFLYKGYNPILRVLLTCLGRSRTKLSFKNNKKSLNKYNRFLNEKLVNYYETKYYQFAHASIIKNDIKENSKYTLVVNRLHTNRNKYNGKLTIIGHMTVSHPKYYPGNKEKVQFLKYNEECELPNKGIIAIDTGACYGNKLTAMIIKKNKYKLEYVKAKKVYY